MRKLLTLDEQITRDEKRLQEKRARAARIKAAAGDGPARKLAKASRLMHALEKSESGGVAIECGDVAARIDDLIQETAKPKETA